MSGVIQLPSEGASLAVGSPITTGSSGSVLYIDSLGNLAQDNVNFNWDDSKDQLVLDGINSSYPRLVVRKAAAQASNVQEWQSHTFIPLCYVDGNLNFNVSAGLTGTTTSSTKFNLTAYDSLSAAKTSYIQQVWDATNAQTALLFQSPSAGGYLKLFDNGAWEIKSGIGLISIIADITNPVDNLRLRPTNGGVGVIIFGISSQSAPVLTVWRAQTQTGQLQYWQAYNGSELGSVSPDGLTRFIAGAGTGFAKVGGPITHSTTETGNSTTTETDLFSYSVPASTLGTNGDSVEFYYGGTFAATVNSKQLRVKFGSTTVFDSGSLAITGATSWVIYGSIIRTGSATQKAIVSIDTSSSVLAASASYTTPTETLSGAITLKLTGQATSTNDILGEIFKASWLPAGA